MPVATARGKVYDFDNISDMRVAYQQRWSGLIRERTTFEQHWRDLSRFMLPRSGRFFRGDKNRGGKHDYNAIYDNAGTRAVRTLGAGMMTGASSPGRPWFKLTTKDPDLAKFKPAKKWLDDVAVRMYKVFAASNTYRALHKIYEELGVFGTACSILLPNAKRIIHHYPVPIGRYALQQNNEGEIVTMYRTFQKSVGEVVKSYGEENVSVAVKHLWEQNELETPVDIMHIIEPREDEARDPANPSARHMPWRSIHMEMFIEEDKMLRISGYPRFPVIAPRWAVDGDDIYGHSAGMDALGDIKQLQQEQYRKGQAVDYKARPPVQAPSSIKERRSSALPGGLRYPDPGQMLLVDGSGPNTGVRAMFEVNLDLSHLLLDIQDVRARIDSALYADLFLMLAHAGPDTRMTATEVAERHEEKLLALGPVLERLHNELLQPLIETTFDIMMANGLIPAPPPELSRAELDIEFVSLLAQAQRQLGSNAIDRLVGNVLTIAQGGRPDVLDKINWDRYVEIYSEKLGIESELIVGENEVAALRRARAAAETAREATELTESQARSANQLANAPTGQQNALTDILGGEIEEAAA